VNRLLLALLICTPFTLRAQLLEIAVERRFATDAKLRVGDTVWVAPGFGVSLAAGVDPDSAAERLNRVAFGYQVYPSRDIASQSSTTFLVVSRFHRAIAIISILASAIFLLCLMVLKVEERRLDVAVLRFTGISRRTVFRSLLLEAMVIAVVGAMIGTGLAALASAVVNWYYQRSFATALIFSLLQWRTILFAIVLSIVLGLGAGALAAWRLVRTPPLALWRRAG
jgi:putative ABC transport system permease protein